MSRKKQSRMPALPDSPAKQDFMSSLEEMVRESLDPSKAGKKNQIGLFYYQVMSEAEAVVLRVGLEVYKSNQSKLANGLGLARATIRQKLKFHGLKGRNRHVL